MPTYDYFCTECNHQDEILQKMTDVPLSTCPQCGKSTFVRKIGKGLGLQFQGSGFYATDYNDSPASSEKKDSATPSKGCGCGKNACPN